MAPRIHCQILPILRNWQTCVVPLFFSFQVTLHSPETKLYFCITNQLKMSPMLQLLQDTRFICVHLLHFLTPISFPLSIALRLPSFLRFSASPCSSKTFVPVASHSPVAVMWSPISFYSLHIFSVLVSGEYSAGLVISGGHIMRPNLPSCSGCESIERCCAFL